MPKQKTQQKTTVGRRGNLPVALTMGHRANELELIVNMTPTKDGLERRPAIIPVELGFSKNTTTNGASSAHQLGTYDSTLDLTQETNPGGASTAETAFASLNNIVEGIDVEIVQDRLVCVYLFKEDTSMGRGLGTTPNCYLGVSWHWPTDPLLGYQFATDSTWVQSNLTMHTANSSLYGSLHKYNAASFWNRRVVENLDYFFICGYGVGGTRLFNARSVNNQEEDAIPIWDSTRLIMDEMPVDVTYGIDNTTIPRVNTNLTHYVPHGPKEAFAHFEHRFAQTFWYGFRNTPYRVNGINIEEKAKASKTIISETTGVAIMRPYDLFLSEPALPQSLNTMDIFPIVQPSGSDAEIVGMASYKNGTAGFTKTSIFFFYGQGGDLLSENLKYISRNIGSTSRWSIKDVPGAVFFANDDGLYRLGEDGSLAPDLAFAPLFEDGIQAGRGPYSKYQGDSDGISASGAEMRANEAHDCDPWQHYRVDKTRLDRAVAGVWDDLYILFCSMPSHEPGDDNRLALVHNWTTGAASVWLLPKHMGVRGFAYNGKFETPFVMTRFGLAKFEGIHARDKVWNLNSDGTGVHASTATHTSEPYPATFIKSNNMPREHVPTRGQPPRPFGDSHVMPDVHIYHNMRIDESVDVDMEIRFQTWSHVADLEPGTGILKDVDGSSTFGYSDTAGSDKIEFLQLSTTDIGTLDGLFQNGLFAAWYKEATGSGGNYAMYAASDGTINSTNRPLVRYMASDITRVSTARSHAQGVAHRFQFHTLNPIKLSGIDFDIATAAERGRR
jgi:hypothetical protein